MLTRLHLIAILTVCGSSYFAGAADSIDISSRRELFADMALIESLAGAAGLQLHHPVPREVTVTFEKPWEGNASGYPTVFRDGDLYRMQFSE